MDGILNSVKKILGLSSDYDVFDADLIMAINTAFFTLWQLGVGKNTEAPFVIHGDSEDWSDFIDEGKIEMCKSYVALRARMLFDPPTSGTLTESINGQIKEYETRMTYAVDEYNNYELK